MTLADTVAACTFVAAMAYAIFAGADFGCGVWDLTAGGDEAGRPVRELIDHSIGPVWEANHVWLVFVLVYLWTGFPAGFAAISETLFVPLSFAGLGIVLRGCTFAFRKFAPSVVEARVFGALFAVSSVVTPFFLGAVAGGVATGRVPLDGGGDRWASWTGPGSIAGGALAVSTCSFLAAVLLCAAAAQRDDAVLVEHFRRRAIASGALTGLVAVVCLAVLRGQSDTLYAALTSRALPILLAAGVAGLVTLWLLWRRRAVAARVAAVLAVAAALAGWGIAQHPWFVVDVVTIDEIAGDRTTLWALVVTFALASVIVLPSLGSLYWLTQRPAWIDDDLDG